MKAALITEEQIKAIEDALEDMLSGWKYIRESHGDLYGIGWDRAESKAVKALTIVRSLKVQEPVAWITRRTGDGGVVISGYETCEPTDYDAIPVYTAPTKREWQALAQPEQEPFAWKLVPIEPTDAMLSVPVNIDLRECVTPGSVTGLDAVGLFRVWEAMIAATPAPPSKPWVSLTDEEIWEWFESNTAITRDGALRIARATEAALKKKNT